MCDIHLHHLDDVVTTWNKRAMTLVALTGASGLLGSNLLVALRRAGVDVRALFRSEGSIAHLRALPDARGVDWVAGDLDDEDALVRAFDGVDAVFHVAAMVSILARVTPALTRANVDGTRRVISACRRAKVRRLIHTSSIVTTGLAPDEQGLATEDSPWDFGTLGLDDGYCVTKKQAEDLVLEAVGSTDLDAVIINPGYLFGPMDSKPSSGKLILDTALGRVPGVTPGGNVFTDVRDVAAGAIAAWQQGVRGERYILGGHNRRYAEVLPLIASRAGVRPPRMSIPRPVAGVVGAIGDLQYRLTGREPLLTSAAVRWSFCTRFRVSSAKAEAALGYRISPLEGAIDDAIDWFRRTGRLPT
jgi:dihydroflavonol-4-reductase